MIPTKQLIVEFDRRFDRFASEFKKNLRLEDKLSVLNEAQDTIFENLVKRAEINSKVRNDLRPFEIKDKSLNIVRKDKDSVVFEIPKDHYKRLRVNCVAHTDECGEKTIPVIIFQTDDLDQALKDSFWAPSYEWENVLGDEAHDGLYLYHNNEFSIIKCVIDYIRKPKGPLQCASMSKTGSYRDSTDTLINYDTDCEFDTTYIWHDIVDLAVLIARSDIGDTRDMRIQREKILVKEQTT
mgnify:CR=1 FL=1